MRWPTVPDYCPDPVGPLKLQDLMKSLPEWRIYEYEVEDGDFKGTRGAEIRMCSLSSNLLRQ